MSKIYQLRSPHNRNWATVSELDYNQSGFEKRAVEVRILAHNYLAQSWSTSRGRDTYGYNICRIDDRATDQRFKCMGGGYDMVGTCIGQWLAQNYQDRLLTLKDRFAGWNKKDGNTDAPNKEHAMYGGRYLPDSERISLDGACGFESMRTIAAAIGVSITTNYNRRKNRTEGYFVTDYGTAEALQADEQNGHDYRRLQDLRTYRDEALANLDKFPNEEPYVTQYSEFEKNYGDELARLERAFA